MLSIEKMKKSLYQFLLAVTFMAGLTSCHESPSYKNTLYGNFDALVDIIDSHYCFFEDKNIDWKATAAQYRELINEETGDLQLFTICSALLDELQDGHVNLTSRFNTTYYKKWWTDYPQDFNLRTLQEYYLDFNWFTTSGIIYKQLPGEIAYMYYPSFSYVVSETSLDYILAILYNSRGLIIDIRDNGGGLLTNIDVLVGRFIEEQITGGYIMHKTGPGHDSFSKPYPITYSPAMEGRIKWPGQIVVLTNRSCFSAANNFVSVMKQLPNVSIVGARTGGGGGMPFSSEIPNGWGIRFSACPILDADFNITEYGIDPSPGCEVHATEEELAQGKDAILEFAMDMLKDNPLPFPDKEEEEEQDN